MDVGSIAICIALGALICFVFTGIGVCIGRGSKDDIKREYELDSDITIYVPCRYRRGSRDKRDHKPDEIEEGGKTE